MLSQKWLQVGYRHSEMKWREKSRMLKEVKKREERSGQRKTCPFAPLFILTCSTFLLGEQTALAWDRKIHWHKARSPYKCSSSLQPNISAKTSILTPKHNSSHRQLTHSFDPPCLPLIEFFSQCLHIIKKHFLKLTVSEIPGCAWRSVSESFISL